MGMVLIPLTIHKGISTSVSLFDLFFVREMSAMGSVDAGSREALAPVEDATGTDDLDQGEQRTFSVADLDHIDRLPILLTVEEAAGILRVSVRTVSRMCADGELPGVQVGRKWRVRTSELMSIIGISRTVTAGDGEPDAIQEDPGCTDGDAKDCHLVPARRRHVRDANSSGKHEATGERFQVDLDKVLGISL
jgi:excisionase family DNA binding protein